jgi:hypothetical protein
MVCRPDRYTYTFDSFQGNPPWVKIDEQKPLGSTFEVATHEVQAKVVVVSV